VFCEPLGGSAPVQPPDAVHVAALVELQVKVEEPPVATTIGSARSTAVGTTFTVTLAESLEPPGPLQLIEYVVLMPIAAVLAVPLVGLTPFQPPDASQEVAFEDDQVSSESPPAATTVGLAVSVTVAATLTVTLAGALVPPGPVQVTTYVTLAVSGPVAFVPLVGSEPPQPPEAAQEVAFVELHVNVALAPLPTEVGAALMLACGTG
jgi:hypothetical protein